MEEEEIGEGLEESSKIEVTQDVGQVKRSLAEGEDESLFQIHRGSDFSRASFATIIDDEGRDDFEDYYRRPTNVGRLESTTMNRDELNFSAYQNNEQRGSEGSGGGFEQPFQDTDHGHDLLTHNPDFILQTTQVSFVTIFEGLALSTVLEEVYLQLEILGHAFPGQAVQPEEADFLTYDERFAIEVKEKDLEFRPILKDFKNPFIVDETQVGTHEERTSHKVQKDRAFLQEIIRRSKVEIDVERTFEVLKDNVMREDGRRNEEMTLMEREKKAMQNVALLRRRIAEFRDQMFRDEHNRTEMINHLKDQLFQEKQRGRMDARYTRAWFEARNDFNFSQLQHTSDLSHLKIKHLEIQMTRDRLCNKNMEAWSNLQFQDIQNKIDDWNEKFETDLEIMDKKIRDKQDVLRGQRSYIDAMNNTIEQRIIALGPWDAEKEKDRTERSAAMRLFFSARIIQRWWREYMIKHNLYKKKKGKKGKGGSTEKETKPQLQFFKKPKPKSPPKATKS